MKSVVAKINPIQEGSGDPSPDNIRPISGWSGVNVSRSGADQTNPTVYSIPFKDSQGNPITVYGGEIDVVKGEGDNDRQFTVFDGTENLYSLGADGRYYLADFVPPQNDNIEPVSYTHLRAHET